MPKYRPILPATGATPNEDEASTQGAATKRRRSAVAVACNTCRTKKVACDGQRPTCFPCLKRGSHCVYVTASSSETPATTLKRELDTLKKERRDLDELFRILKTCPEERSIEILAQLRLKKVDPINLLSFIKGDKPRAPTLPRQVLVYPPPQGGLEFELMARHAVAYPTLWPLDAASVAVVSLPIRVPTASGHGVDLNLHSTWSGAPSSAHSPASTSQPEPSSLVAVPTYCDPRLSQLKVSFWTSIQIADDLAARLISLYLVTDHPILGLFDAELFVADLVNNRPRHCSGLLVSSILSWACHAYSTLAPEANAMGQAFFAEADAIWHQELASDSLTTVAATHLLSMAAIYNGDDGGLPYLTVGIEMARRMGLVGQEPGRTWKGHGKEADHWARATSHAAWGTFNWITMRSFMFQEEEPTVKFPPPVRTPGSGSHLRSEDMQLDMDGPVSDALPDYMGRTFPAICQFWRITSEWTSVYYTTDDTPVSERVPVEFAERTFRKLLTWADNLHILLARGDESQHHCIILHMWFHASILQIFRPFARYQVQSTPNSPTQSRGEFAEAVFAASINQLKHLVIVFRSGFSCANYAVFWHIALLQVANAAVHATDDPEWREYFTFCVNSYGELFGAFRIAVGIIKSLLSIAVRENTLSVSEARAMFNHAVANGTHHSSVDTITATFVVDLDLAVTQRGAAQVETLNRIFDEFTLFDEFTTSEALDVSEQGPAIDGVGADGI